jgi:S1-C subfamily serine protease
LTGRARPRAVLAGACCALLLVLLGAGTPADAGDVADTIARVKRSVVAVGTFDRGRAPAFQFRGTGFAVGAGDTIVTNAHVLPVVLNALRNEHLAILTAATGSDAVQVRSVERIVADADTDLALLKLTGDPLPPLALRNSDTIREGQDILLTGFPIGAVLGPFGATHRGMI